MLDIMSYTKVNYRVRSIAVLLFFFITHFGSLTAQSGSCTVFSQEEPDIISQSRTARQAIQTNNDQWISWQEADNLRFSDGKEMSINLAPGEISQELILQQLQFRLPNLSDIRGIRLTVEGRVVGDGTVEEITTTINRNGNATINRANKALYGVEYPNKVDGSNGHWTYGNVDDLWQSSWNNFTINSSAFGATIQIKNNSSDSLEVFIDKIDIKVDYLPPYILCDHPCVAFFTPESDDIVNYLWQIPPGFERLSGAENEHIINVGPTDLAQPGIYSICVETIDINGDRENCCKTFNLDFCEPSTIGDFVWLDMNANGIQESGDQGIEGVTVHLFTDQGELVASTTSDLAGQYQFNDVIRGEYFIIAENNITSQFPTLFEIGASFLDNDLVLVGGIQRTDVFFVAPGSTVDNIDLGYTSFGSISGVAWIDNNVDGLRQDDESFVPNRKLRLLNEMGIAIDSVVTDIKGAYIFIDLMPGFYQVQLDTLTGVLISPSLSSPEDINNDFDSNALTDLIEVQADLNVRNIDVGLYELVSIGDFVWLDLDRDGIQGVNDEGIADATLRLTNLLTTMSLDVTSDKNGNYQFSDLLPGLYSLEISTATDEFLTTASDVGSDDSVDSDLVTVNSSSFEMDSLVLTSGSNSLDLDFGFIYKPSSIGGIVFEDQSANGLIDIIDNGLEGIAVNLIDGSNDTIASTFTDVLGNYLFDNLNPGKYTVAFDSIENFKLTVSNAGPDDIDSDALANFQTEQIVLGIDEDILTISAGYFRTVSIGDFVFLDRNRDGLQNAGDEGIENVIVNLQLGMGGTIATTETDASGAYLFEGIDPGNYRIQVEEIKDRIITASNEGTDNSIDSDLDIDFFGMIASEVVSLNSGQSTMDLDAGFQITPASISGLAWEDLNADGVRTDNESTLPAVTVNLILDNTIIRTVETDANGTYRFDILDPGTYIVNIEITNEFIASPMGQTNTDRDVDFDTSNNTSEIVLAPGQDVSNIDAGFYRFGAIGDFVFLDVNDNGLQDLDDEAFAGINLSLLDASGNTVMSTSSTTDGSYRFDMLIPGDYQVQYNVTPGFRSSQADVGTDDSIDNDFIQDVDLATTETITIISNQELTTIDAGIIDIRSSISGLVWIDANGDGVRQGIEENVGGVIMTLVDDNGATIATSMTNVDGVYLFDLVVAGEYTIVAAVPSPFVATLFQQGMDNMIDADFQDASGQLTTQTINVLPDATLTNIDAGILEKISIGDFVFLDRNRDGIQNGVDTGIADVDILLLDVNDQVVVTTSSDTNGAYSFTDLFPADYKVQVNPISGRIITLSNIGTDDERDSDLTEINNNLETDLFATLSGEDREDIDLGFQFTPASISGLVWEDLNADGIRSNNETLLPGVNVNLLLNNNIIRTVETDSQGAYMFSVLDPGDYIVSIDISNDFNSSPMGMGSADIDMDFDMDRNTTIITLDPGQDVMNIDGGFFRFGSIGDFIFLDVNDSNLQDAGDIALADIELTLLDASGSALNTTTTSTDGFYAFEMLTPGDYQVQYSVSPGFNASELNVGSDETVDSDFEQNGNLATTDVITISSNEENNNIDGGIIDVRSSVSGLVWIDTNGDGTRQDQEEKVEGVSIELIDGSGIVVDSQMTNSDGSYLFDLIIAGDYTISANVESPFVATRFQQGNDATVDSDFLDAMAGVATSVINIAPDASMTNIDAGILLKASIGDFVFLDRNRDGIQNGTDNGIEGVDIILLDQNNQVVSTTSTDADGAYTFSDLLPGSFSLLISPLVDRTVTLLNAGSDTTRDSDLIDDNGDLVTELITLTSGQQKTDIDLGFQVSPSMISGLVWEDLNANGIRSNNETLIEGVTVNLLVGSITFSSTTTDLDGSYSFTNLDPGAYNIQFELENSSITTTANLGADDRDSDVTNSNGDNSTDSIILTAGTSISNVDAGFYFTTSIGDQVFLDTDVDGLQGSNDPGVADVTVSLVDDSGVVLDTQLTDINGNYLFAGLTPGLYSLRYNYPEGFDSTLPKAGGDDSIDSDITMTNGVGNTDLIMLNSGEVNLDIDGGFVDMRSNISGQVFLDDNGNGMQELSESLFADVVVRLFDMNDNLIMEVETDADGNYVFNNVIAGNYYIEVVAPASYFITMMNVGPDETTDSDFMEVGGIIRTEAFTLGPLVDLTDLDAGIYQLVSIGDFVFHDSDANGLFDAMQEGGIEGIDVNLINGTGSIVATMTTTHVDPKGNGMYLFENLAPGVYQIMVTLDSTVMFTMPNVGMDDSIDSDISNLSGNNGYTDQFLVTSGTNIFDVDVGLIMINLGAITGEVWIDENLDGLNDTNEMDAAGIAVRLFNMSGVQLMNTTTDMDGVYMFDSLMSDNYYIEFDQISSAGFTAANVGGNDLIDSEVTGLFGPGTTNEIFVSMNLMVVDIDAGLLLANAGRIGGLVWEDINCDGLYQVSEPLVQGQKIDLLDASGTLLNSMTTGANGAYMFMDLTAGDYQLETSLDAGLIFTDINVGTDDTIDSDFSGSAGMGSTALITLSTNEQLDDVFAGIKRIDQGSIAGNIWNDANFDGLLMLGEAGVADIELSLLSDAGVLIATTMTDANGDYIFNNLLAGQYLVSFDLPTDFGLTMANVGTDDTIDSDFNGTTTAFSTLITLVANASITDIDAGILDTTQGSIAGNVWNDTDFDGLFQSSEDFLEGVKIFIVDVSMSSAFDSIETDVNGAYEFNNLVAGDYMLILDLPDGFGGTLQNVGTDDTIDSDFNAGSVALTYFFSLTTNQMMTDVDAGILLTSAASISGLVWTDENENGLRDPSETLLQGIELSLFNDANSLVATTTSGSGGAYTFSNLSQGDYYVQADIMMALDHTLANVGMDDTIDSDFTDANGDNTTDIIMLAINESIENIDLGLFSVNGAMVMGQIWIDADENGIFDMGELSREGVEVTLYADGGMMIATTTTDVDGSYLFSGVFAGDYYVVVDNPTGFIFTLADQGMDDTVDSDVTEAIEAGATDLFTVMTNEIVDNVDAGLLDQTQGSISGIAWIDMNGDGIRTAGDITTPGVLVNLFANNGTLLDTQMSDANGAYTFSGLISDDYYIVFVLPFGGVITSADQGSDDTIDSDITETVIANSTDVITLLTNQSINNIDGGYFMNAMITGVVWDDTNCNGIREAGEPMVEGVNISLVNSMAVVTHMGTTNAGGIYTFTDVRPGSYIATMVLPNGKEFTLADIGSDDTIDSDIISMSMGIGTTDLVAVTSGGMVTNVDGGIKDEQLDIDLSGVAWEDFNGDGVRQTTESLLPGVSVMVFNSSGGLEGSTTTNANGAYSFLNLVPGQYVVQFELPTGQEFTTPNEGANDVIDSDVTGMVAPGSTDFYDSSTSNVDAGYFTPACLGDQVFLDFNVNGIFDAGETGLNSIRVRLFDNTGTQVAQKFTGTNPANGNAGFYEFNDVAPGLYFIRVDPSGGLFFTNADQGMDDTVDSDITGANGFGSSDMFQINSGETLKTMDAGLLAQPASVGDFVWNDFNANGIQDAGEPGLDGVAIELYSINNVLFQSTVSAVDPVSGESGHYEFTNIQPGDYYIVFQAPTGLINTDQNQGSSGALDSDITNGIVAGSTNIFNLSSGEDNEDIDGGFFTPACLGDLVFFDTNENGIQDLGEAGVAGVNVTLRRSSGIPISSTVTDQFGLYKFSGLKQGVYFVSFEAPTGLQFTLQDATTDDRDSDADMTGNTPLVSLAAGVDFTDLDAGLINANSQVGRKIWLDNNENGVRETSEVAMPNVMVRLYNTGGTLIQSMASNMDGNYIFTDISIGNYYVEVEKPTGYVFTAQNQGTNEDIDSDVDASGRSAIFPINNNTIILNLDAGLIVDTGIVGVVSEDENVRLTGSKLDGSHILNWSYDLEDVVKVELYKKGPGEIDFSKDYQQTLTKSSMDYYYDYEIINTGAYAYQLRAITRDGKIHLSNTVTLARKYATDHTIKLYPNPTVDRLFIDWKADDSSEAQFTIVDGNGRIVKQFKTIMSTEEEGFEIDVKDLMTGKYYLISQHGKVKREVPFIIVK